MGNGVEHLRHVQLDLAVMAPQAFDREVAAALHRFAVAGTRLQSLRLCRYLAGPWYPIDNDEQCVAVSMCSGLDSSVWGPQATLQTLQIAVHDPNSFPVALLYRICPEATCWAATTSRLAAGLCHETWTLDYEGARQGGSPVPECPGVPGGIVDHRPVEFRSFQCIGPVSVRKTGGREPGAPATPVSFSLGPTIHSSV